MKTQKQCAYSQRLPQLVQEKLSAKEGAQLEKHMESCEACQQTLDELVDVDKTAERVISHLRQSRPVSDPTLLDVMQRIRSQTFGAGAAEPFRLDDFAVDYLHPSDNPTSLGRLGSYEIKEVIGSGGMGIVLKGYDAKLNRVVAVKVLTPVLALNTTARKRFVREAQAAAAVGHPNVVTIHSVDEDRLPYLVMEFVDGPSLQERLDSQGFLQLNQILRIGVQVASGLAAAHAQGLVHRDIKPGNILLENGIERVRLTDFGLARAADDASVTRDGTIVGTPQYMSPEQVRGDSLAQTSDLFSLGSVLYALATGRPPFRADTSYGVMRKIAEETPTPIRELNPELPEWLCDIIDKLMAKRKSDRFESAAQVHELLEGCLSHAQQPTVAGLPKISKAIKEPRKPPLLKSIAGVLIMIAIVTGSLLALTAILFPQHGPADREVSAANTKQLEPEAKAKRSPAKKTPTYQKQFIVAFANPDEVGTLDVDIKRGSIRVSGYDGEEIVVQLTVPNYSLSENRTTGGLRELRPNTLDFAIEKAGQRIKVDGNSYKYVTHLDIKVPRKTNLTLDSYRDGVIVVREVEGRFGLRSQNNDIRMENVSGPARLWTYNGNLAGSFKSAKGGPLYFESYNGSIDVMLPADTKANTRYRSGSGRVSTDFDIALSSDVVYAKTDGEIEFDEYVHGTLNGGGFPLTLATEKGDIRLRKRMSESVRRVR